MPKSCLFSQLVMRTRSQLITCRLRSFSWPSCVWPMYGQCSIVFSPSLRPSGQPERGVGGEGGRRGEGVPGMTLPLVVFKFQIHMESFCLPALLGMIAYRARAIEICVCVHDIIHCLCMKYSLVLRLHPAFLYM